MKQFCQISCQTGGEVIRQGVLLANTLAIKMQITLLDGLIENINRNVGHNFKVRFERKKKKPDVLCLKLLLFVLLLPVHFANAFLI